MWAIIGILAGKEGAQGAVNVKLNLQGHLARLGGHTAVGGRATENVLPLGRRAEREERNRAKLLDTPLGGVGTAASCTTWALPSFLPRKLVCTGHCLLGSHDGWPPSWDGLSQDLNLTVGVKPATQ